jgi:histone deacetylase 8
MKRQREPAAASAPSVPASRILYLLNAECAALADAGLESAHADRSALGHALVAACLLPVSVLRYSAAPLDALRSYHSSAYLEALATPHAPHDSPSEAQHAAGLSYDCAAFAGQLRYASLVAGGSLTAADELGRCRKDAAAPRVALHWDGGRHHARRDAAAGFCFVNDCVLALQRLRKVGFKRMLYIDVDIHHGDAVQDAFYHSDSVLFISMHKKAAGFFPGSGSATELGSGAGRGHTLNLPLADGLRDALFIELFERLLHGAAAVYQPEAVLMVCGCDGLRGDPLGGWSLSPFALAAAAVAASKIAPLLLLGGGGYVSANAARAWAVVTAALAGKPLLEDAPVPDHGRLLSYGPSFQLWDAVPEDGMPPDENGRE